MPKQTVSKEIIEAVWSFSRDGYGSSWDALEQIGGGGRGIRTPVTRKGKAVFKTACFNHSHIPPHRGAELVHPKVSKLRLTLRY